MANDFLCPYCNHSAEINDSTCYLIHPSFGSVIQYAQPKDSEITLIMFKCPHCHEYTICAQGTGSKVTTNLVNIKPNTLAKQFPDYIPKAIRQDYEEAYSIVNLIPKA